MPGAPISFVGRPRLERQLDAVQRGGIGLVVASAGSGKSVLLGQWAESRPDLCVCTVALSSRHNDSAAFVQALLIALARAPQPITAKLAELRATGGSKLGEPFIEGLLAELRAQPDDIVVVLDDLHVLTNSALIADLGDLMCRLPDNVRLVLAARWDPALRLGDLRLEGRLIEVRASDLAFDCEEATELLSSASRTGLSAAQAESLVERTDGWAAGLRLAAISLQSTDDPTDFVESFSGSDRLIVEYLTQEVLDTLDPATRRFLLHTSVLPWLSIDLCDAVTGDGNAREMLAALEQRSLFVARLDPAGNRLRYHQLFADLLRNRLRADDPHLGHRLSRQAAEWLGANGFVEDGIEQLMSAGDHSSAFELVLEHGHGLFERGESATLVQWLSAIERGLPDAPPAVGINLLAAQVAANRFVDAAETHRRLRRRTDLTPGARATADALYACLVLDDLPTAETMSAASRSLGALSLLDDDDIVDFLGIGGRDSVRVIAEYTAALAEFFDEDVLSSRARLARVADLPGVSYIIWRLNTLGAQALIEAWLGHLDEAHRLATSALSAAAAAGVTYHVAASSAFAALGVVGLERHDIGLATRSLSESAARIQRGRGATFDDLQRLLAARLAAITDGHVAALAALRNPAHVPGRPLLAHAEDSFRTQLLIAEGDLLQAKSVMSRGERPPATGAALIDLDLATREVDTARRNLDRWVPDSRNLTEVVEHRIRTAAVLDAEGHPDEARAALLHAASEAAAEGLRRPFLDHSPLLRLLAPTSQRGSQTFVRSLLDAAASAEARRSGQAQLIEPLTERELAVLDFLPSRLSNAGIGRELYVSTNTIKTHLRNIYRKLDATDRDDAVERAIELGLL